MFLCMKEMEQVSTQYIMTTLEELGLLKMDFLGLRTLTVIQDTIDLVKKDKGTDVEFDANMTIQKSLNYGKKELQWEYSNLKAKE